MCVAQFTLRDLVQEYILIFLAKDETTLKITLAGNQYTNFESVLENLKFLLAAWLYGILAIYISIKLLSNSCRLFKYLFFIKFLKLLSIKLVTAEAKDKIYCMR